MKTRKPEIHTLDSRFHRLMKWLSMTGGVMTLGGMIPTTVFAADNEAVFPEGERK